MRVDLTANVTNMLEKALKQKFSIQIFTLWAASIITAIWMIWKVRNEAIFEGKVPSRHHVLACIHSGVYEADSLENGCMRNSILIILILRCLQIKGRVGEAPRIIEVQWHPSDPGWIKVNIDGSANGSPDPAGCGGIFLLIGVFDMLCSIFFLFLFFPP